MLLLKRARAEARSAVSAQYVFAGWIQSSISFQTPKSISVCPSPPSKPVQSITRFSAACGSAWLFCLFGTLWFRYAHQPTSKPRTTSCCSRFLTCVITAQSIFLVLSTRMKLSLDRGRRRPSLIAGVIVTHCHADHDAGTFQKVLLDVQVNIISTRWATGSKNESDARNPPFLP